MIRKRISRIERPPSTVTTTCSEIGGSYSESLSRRPDADQRATTVTKRMIGMNSSASQALPPAPGTLPTEGTCTRYFDPEPIEEHEYEEQDRRDAGDLLSGVEPV